MSLSLLLRVNIIVVIVVLFIYVFMQYVHNKRKNKESYILKRYDYQPLTYHLLKDTVFVVVAAILFVIISIPLCIGLNAMINSIFEGSVLVQLFDWNILQIMITFALCIIFIILEEGLFYVFSFKKYK